MLSICRLLWLILQKAYAGAVWAIIDNFRAIDVVTELSGDNIYRLENGFTMSVDLHDAFDDLSLWLEHDTVSSLNYSLIKMSSDAPVE